MKTPPFLLGAALIFWGWQTDFLVTGAVMALILEGARFIHARWELTDEDFSRIWTFCAVVFLATGVYAFTASDGPASVGSWFSHSGFSAYRTAGAVSARTAVRLIRWLPMDFFLFIAAQAYSNREGIPLETISLILRRRWRRARELGQPVPESRAVNVGYPYLATCLFAASSHPLTGDNGFFWGLCVLLAWALWPQRSQRFGLAVWGGVLAVAIALGFGGQRGLVRLKQSIDQRLPEWLGLLHRDSDPLESRTEIGQIGRIQTSSQIVIRLETAEGVSPPPYLREAAYRTYRSGVWYAGSSKDDFTRLIESSLDSQQWALVPGKTNGATLNIACYLPGGKGLLPLPTASGQLDHLLAYQLEKNSLGAVREEGPGLVIFNAVYGRGPDIERAPDTNEDLSVPDREKPALDSVIAEMRLNELPPQRIPQAINNFFTDKFTYSLWQKPPRHKNLTNTALGNFLLKTRSGHCEYFATATVLLLRELNIPARYTIGYAVHEASGNHFTVRASDAHAWCRVWDPRRQNWEDFDTTPGVWLDIEKQHRSSFQFIADAWSSVKFELAKLRWGQNNFRQYILWGLVPVLALLLYQIIFRSGRRKARRDSAADAQSIMWPGLDSEFYQLEREFAKRGLVRHASEPVSVWLGRSVMEPGLVGMREALSQLQRLHYRYRFDPEGLTAAEREALRRDVVACLARVTAEQ
jgi:hypothetical protein